MGSKIAPCLNCKERCTLCHKDCERYLAYKYRINSIKEAKQLIREKQVTHYLSKIGLNIYKGF